MINFYDLETLPTNDESVIKDLEKTICPPGNIKKPESITIWMEENKESALAELIANTSFDGLYGRIACIAWCSDDDKILSTSAASPESEAIEMYYEYLSFSQDKHFFLFGFQKTQDQLQRERTMSNHVTPLPAPGVMARNNSVDTPALLPDGSTSIESLPNAFRGEGKVAKPISIEEAGK